MKRTIEMINAWFGNFAGWQVKNRWKVLIGYVLIVVVSSAGMQFLKTDSSIESWLLEDDPLKKATDQFEEIFGNNDFVALLIEAEDVFAPEILTMLRELGEEIEQIEYADKVTSLANMEFSRVEGEEGDIIIEPLVPDIIPTDQQEIEEIRQKALSKISFVNRIVSDDSKLTWLMVRLEAFPNDWEEKGMAEPNSVVGKALFEIIHQQKYEKYTLKAAGMPVTAIEEFEYFGNVAAFILVLALIAALLILIIFLRSLRGVLIPIITMTTSIVIVFGIMGYLGIKINTVIVTVPIFLGLAVSIGYSIHIFNFYKRHLILTGERKEAVCSGVKETGWPILFTALTTIGSLLSFYFVDLAPIRWLGFTSAAVIASVYIGVMMITPPLLSFGKDNKVRADKIKTELPSDKYFIAFAKWVLAYSLPIFIIFMFIMAGFAYGLTRVTINVNIEKSYGLKVPYIKRLYEIARTKLGSWASYDLTLKFKVPGAVKDPDVLRRFDRLTAEVSTLPVTKRTSSILDLLKDMNRLLNEDKKEYYTVPDSRELVAQELLLYEMSGGEELNQWVNHDYSMLRLMVEIDKIDALQMVSDLEFIKTKSAEIFPEAEVGLSGSLAQFAALNEYISMGQIKSFLIALTVIMFLMMLVFKSIKTGLIGMIPNITPAIVVGGLMGLLDIPLDFYTITLIPMILGLAVDDTIHFIDHAQVEYHKTGDYDKAIAATFKTVGKALFMTSFIVVASFSLYMISDAKMLFNIGLFIAAGLSSALLADYLITPILVKWTRPFDKDLEDGEEGEE